MATYRVHKTSNYTVMSNTHLQDKTLSLKSKGLLSVMLSLPDNWEYTIAGLVAISKENEAAVKGSLDELKKSGYLVVTKLTPAQTESGRFEYLYDIYEQPQQKQEVEKQGVEKQGVEILPIENQGQLNTKQLNTKQSNTNKEIYIAVIDYLNSVAGTHYKATSKDTQRHISARIKEGYKIEDFKRVVDNMWTSWRGTEWEQYMRPSTLFGSKFENYLNRKPQVKKGAAVNSSASDLDGVF